MTACGRGLPRYGRHSRGPDRGRGRRCGRGPGEASRGIQEDEVFGVHQVELLAGDLLRGELLAVRGVDRGRQALLLPALLCDLPVELLHVGLRLPKLEDSAVRRQERAEEDRRHGEGDEKGLERLRLAGGLGAGTRGHEGTAPRPAKTPVSARSSSISSSRLYLESRSLRDADPVLIRPLLTATARSAIESSHVSPERCDTTVR